jgi:hypothetical protein
MPNNFTVYSFADVRCVFNHPDIGQYVLSADGGIGKITVERAGDMSSHTATSNGYTTINRMKSDNGTATIEVPQNSPAEKFLRKAVAYLDICPSDRFAEGSITVYDQAAGETIQCTGVTPQKRPGRTYEAAAGNVAFPLLAADIQDK